MDSDIEADGILEPLSEDFPSLHSAFEPNTPLNLRIPFEPDRHNIIIPNPFQPEGPIPIPDPLEEYEYTDLNVESLTEESPSTKRFKRAGSSEVNSC